MYPDSLENIQVILKDRERISGKYLGLVNDTLILEVDLVGKLRVAVAHIKDVRPRALPDLRKHHSVATPTGFGMEKGNFQYTNSVLVFSSVEYGFTRWLSGGFGALTFPGEFVPGVTVKLSFPLFENSHISFGNLSLLTQNTVQPLFHFPFAALSIGNSFKHIDFYYSRMFLESLNDLNHLAGISGKLPMGNNQYMVGNLCLYFGGNYYYTNTPLQPSAANWRYKQYYTEGLPSLSYRKIWPKISLQTGFMVYFSGILDPEEFIPYISLSFYTLPEKYRYSYFEKRKKQGLTPL